MRSLYLALVLAGLTHAQNLMPMPAHVSMQEGRLAIGQGFCITTSGQQLVQNGGKRLLDHIAKKTGMPMKPDCGSGPGLQITAKGPGDAVQKLGEAESYRLEVTPTKASLTADNPLGALRGMETFLQLIEPAADAWSAPAVVIDDAPRFSWRGLHIDVSRHWMPLDVILRNLDAMAAVKLNVFHWHLSDDQGFRIESKRYPKLQELGSDGHYYTQVQVREVIAYARERGIRVVPEFDIPAHATAWLVGYPELAAAPGPYEIGRHWGIFEPTLDPTKETVYTFLDNFIGEMAHLFPDEYFHIGGDEVNGKQWTASKQIAAFKKAHNLASNDALQAYFNKRIQAIVKKHGKRMEGWDEILDPALPKDIVIQSWRGLKSLAQAADMGYEGLLSTPYYLDAMKPAADMYLADPLDKEAASLAPEQQKRILGGEVCMWAEYLTPENIDSRIWPRTAAIAERFWSPREVNDLPSMYRRLGALNRELGFLGLKQAANYQLMLRRIAGTGPVKPVQTLADVVTPVRLGGRARARKYTQQTPLNRLCDTAMPESAKAHEFAALVDDVLAGKRSRAELRPWLIAWRDNPPLPQNFLTEELAPLQADLKALGTLGLAALDALEAGQRLQDSRQGFLESAAKPRAEVSVAIVPAIKKLVDAASR